MGANQTKYLIVGGSAAGMAAAHTIRAHDPAGRITLVTEEANQPYYRPMIPYLVSGEKTPGDMDMAGFGPFTQPDIEIRTSTRVKGVDPGNLQALLENGQTIVYEKLLLATGSRPYIPPEIEGTGAPGVFALRTLEDARNMAKQAEKTRRAVLLGGGLLNLKAAFALLARHIKVTLVVFSPQVLSQLMDQEDAWLIRKALDRAGLEIKTGAKAIAIVSGRSGVTGVTLDNGTQIPCEMVCIGKGVRPNVAFLKNSGIALEKGIVADQYTACSCVNVYAAGDAAVTHDPVTGEPVMTALWTNAVEMGRCAGLNMAGIRTAYSGTFGILNATQVADLPFVSMGMVHTKDLDCEVHCRNSKNAHSKMVFSPDGSRLIGTVLVGEINNAGLLRHIIQGKMDITRIKQQIVDHALHWGHIMK